MQKSVRLIQTLTGFSQDVELTWKISGNRVWEKNREDMPNANKLAFQKVQVKYDEP